MQATANVTPAVDLLTELATPGIAQAADYAAQAVRNALHNH